MRRQNWDRALIDGDIIVYRVGFAAQTKFYDVYDEEAREWGPIRTFKTITEMKEWLHNREGNYGYEERIVPDKLGHCLHSVKLQVQAIINATQCMEHRILLTGKGNYRESVDYYKDNRDRDSRPIHFDAIREYLIKRWGAKIVNYREADDALAILQYKDYNNAVMTGDFSDPEFDTRTIICTIDKDLLMVPGWHYHIVDKKFKWVEPIEGLRWFYTQMITGDTADNIPGLFQIAKKKAMQNVKDGLTELDTEEDMWNYVVDVYFHAFRNMDSKDELGIDEAEIVRAIEEKLAETGRLLWMQRFKDDMWRPPNQRGQLDEEVSSGNSH